MKTPFHALGGIAFDRLSAGLFDGELLSWKSLWLNSTSTKPTGRYQAIQIHDYLSVSFFQQPAEIKAASSKIIETFQRYYPETVSYKYFWNVPLIMQ
jgi:hypothetical protein